MALAIIQLADSGPRGPRLRIDVGSNLYYSYAIGGADTVRENGLEMLAAPTFTSELLGPLGAALRGRALIDIAAERFDRTHRSIQLASFRTRDRVGPALSDVLTLPLGDPGGYPDLPPPAGEPMTSIVANVPYSYQRSRDYSSAMFLEAITSLLPKLLPAIGPLLGGLFGGGGGGGAAGGAVANPLAALGNPETIKAITDLIKQISSAKALGGSVVYSDRTTQQAAAFALSRYRNELSEAKVAPALLAALPALMPLIEKVLNPDTMKAIMENVGPGKLIGTVSDAIGSFAKLGMENTKQLQDHLERLNPGVKNPELYGLLAGLSSGEARAGSKLSYRRVDSVKLVLAETASQTLYGRSRLAYQYGRDLSFPLELETPSTLRHATLEVTLKEANTLKVVYEKRLRLDEVRSGRIETVPSVPWSTLSRLRSGEDYLLGFALCWPGKHGKSKRGTALSQLITLVEEYAFDRVEEMSPDLVALSDETRDRDYWHRLWDQTFEQRGLTRVRLSCVYCYVLEGERHQNARMETKTKLQLDEDARRHTGTLKSGMILSPDALSRLLPRLSGGRTQALAEAQLAALRTSDFADRFNQESKTEVDLKGRRGDSAALWVYPEMRLAEVVLKRIARVNEHGHVEQFEEETVSFPMPAMVHFVGASSAS